MSIPASQDIPLTLEKTPLGAPALETTVFSPAVAAVPEERRIVANRFYLLQVLATVLPFVVADLVGSFAALYLAAELVKLFVPAAALSVSGPLLTLSAIALVAYPMFGLYSVVGVSPVTEFRQFVLAITCSFAVLAITYGTFRDFAAVELLLLAVAWVGALIFIPLLRMTLRAVLTRCPWWGQPVVVVGGGEQGSEIFRKLCERPGLGLRPVGIVDEPHAQWEGGFPSAAQYLGPPASIAEICREQRAFWVIVAVAEEAAEEVLSLIQEHGARIPNVLFVPSIKGLPSLWTRPQDCVGNAAIHVREQLLLPLPWMIKRLVDLLLAVVGGLLISPLLLLIGVCIKLSSPGPVLFSHPRLGHHGRRFRIWKFRTMVEDADELLEDYLDAHPDLRGEWEKSFKLRSDPRVIKGVGHFLRKTSMDELPQIWNVIRGEMSLIGPRPIGCGEVQKYSAAYPQYRKVRPGMTGLWQVSGRSLTTYQERLELDCYYVRNWSPWLDAYILVRTIKTVLLCEGAY